MPKRKQLKSKEVKEAVAPFNYAVSKKDKVELVEDEKFSLLVINNQPLFFYYQNKLLPTLKLLQRQLCLSKITVDQGAVKFVINGADIMRPGITAIDSAVQENEAIVIVDETHQKPLAVGIALFAAEKMQAMSSGKVIKNIHYVGDELWRL